MYSLCRHRPIAVLLLTALLFAAAAGYCRHSHPHPTDGDITMSEPPRTISDSPISSADRPAIPEVPYSPALQIMEAAPEKMPEPEAVLPSEPVSMENCLLIGDSRTVGLQMFGTLENADFFAAAGLGPQRIDRHCIEIGDLGKLTLTDLLARRPYERIYLMMGINDVGYPAGSTIKKYAGLVEQIRTLQPNAILILLGNLHVTKAWSDNDPIINNLILDTFNAETAALADDQSIFYLDPNPLFDDADGALSADKCSDGAHLRPRCYIEWSQWLTAESGKILCSLQGADTP